MARELLEQLKQASLHCQTSARCMRAAVKAKRERLASLRKQVAHEARELGDAAMHALSQIRQYCCIMIIIII